MLEERFWERVGFLVLPILTIERASVADAVHQALGYLERYDSEIRHSILANQVLGILVILGTLGVLFPWLLSLSAGRFPGMLGMTPAAAKLLPVALSFFAMFYLMGLVGILHRVHQGILYHRAVSSDPGSGPSRPR